MELPDKFKFNHFAAADDGGYTAEKVGEKGGDALYKISWHDCYDNAVRSVDYWKNSVQNLVSEGTWITTSVIEEEETSNVSQPHKHAELIHKWADGAVIQYQQSDGWITTDNPTWDEFTNYRVKPQEERKLELNFSVNEKQAKLLLTALNMPIVVMRENDFYGLNEYSLATPPFWNHNDESVSVAGQLEDFLGVK